MSANGSDSDNTVGEQEDTEAASPSILVNPVSHLGHESKFEIQRNEFSMISLNEIMKEQKQLENKLTASTIQTCQVADLETCSMHLEKSLKSVSLVNQQEKQRIIGSYNSDRHSLNYSLKAKDNLRLQLVALAENQKLLLSCVNKQKDISQMIQKRKEALVAEQQPTVDNNGALNDDNTDFAQPVGLDALIVQKFLEPGKDCLSCVLMGCQFTASLLPNGCIQNTAGKRFSLPQQWVSDCWTTLGHTKKITRKHAYRNIHYNSQALMRYCEMYNRRQVSTYMKNCIIPEEDTMIHQMEPTVTSFNLTEILAHGIFVQHQPPSGSTSMYIPNSFWDKQSFKDLPLDISTQIEKELSS